MGKSGGSAPAPPQTNPTQEIADESSQNRLTTYRPDGSIAVEYGYIDGGGGFVGGASPEADLPQAAVRTTETEFEEQLRGIQEAAALGTANTLSGNVDALTTAPTYDATANDMAQRIYDRSAGLLREDIADSSKRLDTNLQARGLAPGSAAYNSAIQDAQRTESEAWSNLAQDAVLAAQGEARADYAAKESERASRLGELAPLMGGSYMPAGYQSVATGGSGVNVSGAYANKYASEMANYNAQMQAQQQRNAATNSLIGTGASLGGMLLFCSETLKRDRAPLCADWAESVIRNVEIETWRYVDRFGFDQLPHASPMAERFHKVTGLGDDKMLNPIDVIAVLWAAVQGMQARLDELEAPLV